MRRVLRLVAWLVAGTLLGLVLFIASLALPVEAWRTGRSPAPPLDLVRGGPEVRMPVRVWIDTDAACGAVARADPDDCYAIALLARARGVDIVGVSTVFGNAPLDTTDRTTRGLVAALAETSDPAPPVHTGAAHPDGGAGSQAATALRRALADGSLTILALGPLTNVAAALADRPDLQRHVGRLVAVMGRRPGHIFHPAEGNGGAMLLGHGPVLRDLNLVSDPRAAAAVLAMNLPVTLVPYDASRDMRLTAADLARIGAADAARRWIVARSEDWLTFWREGIGAAGFAPFDLLAAAYLLDPGRFDCAPARAQVAPDRTLWHHWFFSPEALLVHPPGATTSGASVLYCPQVAPDLHAWLVATLSRPKRREKD